LANQPITIFRGTLGKVVDEGLDLVPVGISQSGSFAEVGGVGLHEAGFQMVLTDQQAEAIAEPRLAVLVAIVYVRGGFVRIGRRRCFGSRGTAEFLDRTEVDAVSLAQRTIDRTSFGGAHLRAME